MDRTVRVQVGGALALVAALAWAMGNAPLVWLAVPAAILIVTGFAGFCPAYMILGINTAKPRK